MDDRSFDRLARLLGGASDRRTGLRALVGGLLGAGGLAALDVGSDADTKRKDRDQGQDRSRGSDTDAGADADADKRKKTCKPACTAGYECVKTGKKGKKKRTCVCRSGVTCGAACCALGQSCVGGQCRAATCSPPCANGYACIGNQCVCPSGVLCGTACCAAGQTCQGGTCADDPDPDTCIPAGDPCDGERLPCCDGAICASGQDGLPDVACYVPESGACERTAECVFGTECRDGACQPPLPPPPVPVDGLGAACDPATNVCTSPGAICQAYVGDHPIGLSGTYCTLPLGATCTANPDCGCYSCGYAEGAALNGRRTARGAAAKVCCGPQGFACATNGDCCAGNVCTNGACTAKAPSPVDELGAACDPATNVCTSPDATCQAYDGDHPIGLSGTYCTLPLGATCTANPDCECYSCGYAEGSFRSGRRKARTAADKVCCGPRGYACTANEDCCEDHVCTGNVCTAKAGCTVCKRDACPYSTIAAAINAGETDIRVGSGVYVEKNLPMPPSPATKLRIRACGNARPVIDAQATANSQGRIMVEIPSGTSVTIKGIEVKRGYSATYGGGFRVAEGGSLTLDGVTVSECNVDDAGEYGGGVYSEGALTILDSTITRCNAGYGGGLYITKGSLTMTRSSVVDCSTYEDSSSGGGIYIEGDVNEAADLPITMTDCVIADNFANDVEGGGMSVTTAKVTMTRVTFTGNQLTESDSYGGGLYLEDIAAGSTLTDCIFEGNYSYYKGGGLAIYDSVPDLHVIRGSISGNSVDYQGGGVYVGGSSNVTFTDVRIAGNWITNVDEYSGYNGAGVFVTDATVTFNGASRIENNQTNPDFTPDGVSGGGLHMEGGDVTVTLGKDTVVSGNRASENGGGIHLFESGTLTVEGTVRDNTATGNGGGIATKYDTFWGSTYTVTLAGTAVISGNSAGGSGDGVYSDPNETNGYIGCTGAPRVCENPGASATATDNCGGSALASSCASTVCAAGACPA